MKYVQILLATLFLSGAVSAYKPIEVEASLKAVQARLDNELAFQKRIEQRIAVAREALAVGQKKAEQDLKQAHIHFEVASIIARTGLALTEVDVPPVPGNGPSESAIQFWMGATAVSAAERLAKGMENYRSYEEFALRYANNEYHKDISVLEEKLQRYVKTNIVPLTEKRTGLMRDSEAVKVVLGKWFDGYPSDPGTFIFKNDGTAVLTWREHVTVFNGPTRQSPGRWVYTGKDTVYKYSWWVKEGEVWVKLEPSDQAPWKIVYKIVKKKRFITLGNDWFRK